MVRQILLSGCDKQSLIALTLKQLRTKLLNQLLNQLLLKVKPLLGGFTLLNYTLLSMS